MVDKIRNLTIGRIANKDGVYYDYFIDGEPLSSFIFEEGNEFLIGSEVSIFDGMRYNLNNNDQQSKSWVEIVNRSMIPGKDSVIDFPVYECPLCGGCGGFVFKVQRRGSHIIWSDLNYSDNGKAMNAKHLTDEDKKDLSEIESRTGVRKFVFDTDQYKKAVKEGIEMVVSDLVEKK